HGREGVAVHAGQSPLHSTKNVAVIERRKPVRQAALNTNLGGAQIPRFHRFGGDLIRTQEVGVVFARAATESTKFAAHKANVSEVDITVDDVGDQIAGELGAQLIGSQQQSQKVVAFTIRERKRLFFRERTSLLPGQRNIESFANRR